MKECLEGIVGLSRTECDCYDFDETLKESKLNLFLDELEGIDLQLIQNALGCGEELASTFNTLYNNAVNFFETDLQVAIAENYKQKYKPFIGKVGETKYNTTVATNTYVGMLLDTKHIDGASIILKSINLYFNNTGSIVLKVYKNEANNDGIGEELESFDITIDAAITSFTLPAPLSLPIVEDGVKYEYSFVYETGTMQPMNNKVSCGCAGVEQVRGKFITPKGLKGATLNDMVIDSRYAYGMSLNVNISCSIDSLLCGFMETDNTFYRMAGQAIWYKLGVLTIEKLFSSREINFDTFSDREYLYGRKNKFDKNYRNIILWLSENTTINNSECFACGNSSKIKMGKILI